MHLILQLVGFEEMNELAFFIEEIVTFIDLLIVLGEKVIALRLLRLLRFLKQLRLLRLLRMLQLFLSKKVGAVLLALSYLQLVLAKI